jgi:hypothetical protein
MTWYDSECACPAIGILANSVCTYYEYSFIAFASRRGSEETSQFVIACVSGAGDAVTCYGEEVASGLVLALVV